MNEVEKAYLAGIVDGEGTVTLTRRQKNETHAPCVAIANNNLALLEWVRSRVGGVIVRKKKRLPHHGNSYVWRAKQDRALHLLNDIKQYLIIKKRHAELLTSEYKKVTHRAGKYTPETLARKNALVARIRMFNQR